MVFVYVGIFFLVKELKLKFLSEIVIGDVLIQGGSFGYVVMVVDLVFEEGSGKIMVLLVQSYMFVQDIYILKNLGCIDFWYFIDEYVQ